MTDFSFFKNKKIIVTGSSGLLGSWLVEDLVENNAEVTGISIDNSKDDLLKSKGLLQKIETHYLNVANYSQLEKVFSSKNFDIIFHLAAQTQVTEALRNPVQTLESNIQGTWNVLELCRKFNFPIVSASSDKSYGISDNLPYIESHPLNGKFPYEVSKSSSDLISTMYKTTYGLSVVSLRCGNIFGGGDFNWDRLIPGTIKTFLENSTPVLRTKGDFVREWVYVKDVSSAYLEVAKAMLEEKNNFSAYNFSSGESKTVKEIYEVISHLINGKIIEPIIDLDSEFEIKNQTLDSSLIKNDLGIYSKYEFDQSLEETIKWYKTHLGV
tara:strand:- start:579 stop:1553 length:975 start_codon:yes stop_codon:yes gene_type:complete